MLKVALTGGIASGKTQVSERFAALGASVIDTDLIARELVAPEKPLLARIREHFGTEVLKPDGMLDRRRLRELVFARTELRHQLEDLLHPAIRTEVEQFLEKLDSPYVILVIPLLFETRYPYQVDRVLVVDVPENIQLARLMKRDKLSKIEAQNMLAAQIDRKTRLASADDLIFNDSDLNNLDSQVEYLHHYYLSKISTP